MKPSKLVLLLFGLAPSLLALDAGTNTGTSGTLPVWAIGPFTRPQDGQPVISPNSNTAFGCPLSKAPVHWEKSWVYNPAAVVKDGKVVVLYRAQQGPGNSCSRIGYAESEDGIHFKTDPSPVLFPADDSQKSFEWSGSDAGGGCEDPRLTESPDGNYILTYTQYNGGVFRLGLATSKDLKHWTKQGGAFAGTKWESDAKKSATIVREFKDGRLVAAKINGKYWMYFGEVHVWMATSDDLIHWTPLADGQGNLKAVLGAPDSKVFDHGFVEVGPAALLTKDGIVLFYNGVNGRGENADPDFAQGTYCGGQALFDRHDPTKLIARLDKPYIRPELPWEKTGLYKDGTTFTEGLVFFKKQWFVYFGCADSRVGVAIAPAKTN